MSTSIKVTVEQIMCTKRRIIITSPSFADNRPNIRLIVRIYSLSVIKRRSVCRNREFTGVVYDICAESNRLTVEIICSGIYKLSELIKLSCRSDDENAILSRFAPFPPWPMGAI